MPQLTREQKIAKAQRELKTLQRKHKLLGTLIAKKKRSLGALQRALAKKGPTPPPAPPEPGVLFAALDAAAPDAGEADKAALLAQLQAHAEAMAKRAGVHKPRVRWSDMRGACKRVHRAHVHGFDTWWRSTGKKAHSHGDICVNHSWFVAAVAAGKEAAEDLMAHEVAHLTTGGRGVMPHGRAFDERLKEILGRAPIYHVDDAGDVGDVDEDLHEDMPNAPEAS